MTATADKTSEQTYVHDDALWKPRLGATSTFADLLHAQGRVLEIWNETDWNPWREAELAEELAWTHQVMREWTRAEPDHRPMTKRRVAALNAGISRKVKAERAADEVRWVRDKARYDPERERARFSLFERLAIHSRNQSELDEYRSGGRFPGMPAGQRTERIRELEEKIERDLGEVARLESIVGDSEDVVDEDGKLPRDRRKWNIIMYGIRRRSEVEQLKQAVSKLQKSIKETSDRTERSTLSTRLALAQDRLDRLLAVPILTAEDMCADCYTPSSQHGYGDVRSTHPCPRWPLHAAQMEKVWAILRTASGRRQPETPAPPKPQPLVTLPGGLTIAEVIARLTEIQQEHPTAVVKRGRANRWEIWASEK